MDYLTELSLALLITFATVTFLAAVTLFRNSRRGLRKARIASHMADLLRGYPDLAREVRPVLSRGTRPPARHGMLTR